VGKRSPVLGYNHNFKHRGLIFHVQTEDSGVDNPHLFTHCFHGGVIIASRRKDYDPSEAESAVKGYMQNQHRRMLKDLKVGAFDDKIDTYFGKNADLEPRVAPTDTKTPEPAEDQEAARKAAQEKAAADAARIQAEAAAAESARIQAEADAQIARVAAARARAEEARRVAAEAAARAMGAAEAHSGAIALNQLGRSSTPEPMGDPTVTFNDAPRPPRDEAGVYSMRRSSERRTPQPELARSSQGKAGGKSANPDPGRPRSSVVVSRPAVIIGAPPKVAGKRKSARKARSGSLFGKDMISEKSLDEVIMAYLSDDGGED
jgi:hypothetical protein